MSKFNSNFHYSGKKLQKNRKSSECFLTSISNEVVHNGNVVTFFLIFLQLKI